MTKTVLTLSLLFLHTSVKTWACPDMNACQRLDGMVDVYSGERDPQVSKEFELNYNACCRGVMAEELHFGDTDGGGGSAPGLGGGGGLDGGDSQCGLTDAAKASVSDLCEDAKTYIPEDSSGGESTGGNPSCRSAEECCMLKGDPGDGQAWQCRQDFGSSKRKCVSVPEDNSIGGMLGGTGSATCD